MSQGQNDDGGDAPEVDPDDAIRAQLVVLAEEAALAEGDEAAQIHAEAAAGLTALGDLYAAEVALAEAFEAAEDPALQAEYLYGRGVLQAEQPDRADRADATLVKAKAMAFVLGDFDLELKAAKRLIKLRTGQLRLDEGIGALTDLIERLGQVGRRMDLLHALRLRANLYLGQGPFRLKKVMEDLDHAVALAERLEQPAIAFQLRMERRGIHDYLGGGATPERLEDMLEEARALDDEGLAGQVRFAQATAAMRQGRPAEAEEHATAAREGALEDDDPVRYVLACMVIAEARDALGDRAGVLEILLRCKSSLEERLGRDAGQQVVVVLDSLQHRWGGQQAVLEALAEYRARMAAEG